MIDLDEIRISRERRHARFFASPTQDSNQQRWAQYLRHEEDDRWPPYMPRGSIDRAKRDDLFQAFLEELLG